MPWDNGGGGDDKRSHSYRQSAFEGFNRRRNKLGQMIPDGSRLPGSFAFLVATVLAAIMLLLFVWTRMSWAS